MAQRIWFERSFALGTPIESFPEILERVRGTPARIDERVRLVRSSDMTTRDGEAWSIQEHVGHLADLESLWLGRVADLTEVRAELRPADLENTATWEAQHNHASTESVLARFREQRAELIERLEAHDDGALRATALHPRLRQPMTVVDLCFFVAEHDDHHLAKISKLIGALC